MQEEQKEQAAKDSKPYYDNDLVVAKPDGAPVSASWVSSQFGKLLEDLDMPHIRFHDLRHPYVKHTTKIFSLRLKFFQAQPVPDALRKLAELFCIFGKEETITCSSDPAIKSYLHGQYLNRKCL